MEINLKFFFETLGKIANDFVCQEKQWKKCRELLNIKKKAKIMNAFFLQF